MRGQTTVKDTIVKNIICEEGQWAFLCRFCTGGRILITSTLGWHNQCMHLHVHTDQDKPACASKKILKYT